MIIDPKKIIIVRPDRKTLPQRASAVLFFLMFWGALLYLLRPLLLVVGWWLGYRLFESVIDDVVLDELLETVFLGFLPPILFLSGLLGGWAFYNRMRFRGYRDKRRVPPPPLTVEDISTAYSLTPEQIREIHEAKRLICHFQDNGEIEAVECCPPSGNLSS